MVRQADYALDVIEVSEDYRYLNDTIKASVTNGCGPQSMKRDLVPDKILGISIEGSCRYHDYEYFCGKTWEDKKKADKNFLNNMLRQIDAEKNQFWIMKQARYRIAYAYYLAVKRFGSRAFWEGKNDPRKPV